MTNYGIEVNNIDDIQKNYGIAQNQFNSQKLLNGSDNRSYSQIKTFDKRSGLGNAGLHAISSQ